MSKRRVQVGRPHKLLRRHFHKGPERRIVVLERLNACRCNAIDLAAIEDGMSSSHGTVKDTPPLVTDLHGIVVISLNLVRFTGTKVPSEVRI